MNMTSNGNGTGDGNWYTKMRGNGRGKHIPAHLYICNRINSFVFNILLNSWLYTVSSQSFWTSRYTLIATSGCTESRQLTQTICTTSWLSILNRRTSVSRLFLFSILSKHYHLHSYLTGYISVSRTCKLLIGKLFLRHYFRVTDDNLIPGNRLTVINAFLKILYFNAELFFYFATQTLISQTADRHPVKRIYYWLSPMSGTKNWLKQFARPLFR